ncbi:MAG: response regulator transcription factor [Candidatus Limnocylindrales bacterium]
MGQHPSATSRMTVLTIDDQPRFRAVARQLVDSVLGLHAVGDASTGQEGMALARSLRPDVVLLDVNLPDIDGIEVCRQLRGERPTPTVILVSSDDEHEYAVAARECGAIAFVPKQRLTAGLLQAILSGDTRAGGAPYAAGEAGA